MVIWEFRQQSVEFSKLPSWCCYDFIEVKSVGALRQPCRLPTSNHVDFSQIIHNNMAQESLLADLLIHSHSNCIFEIGQTFTPSNTFTLEVNRLLHTIDNWFGMYEPLIYMLQDILYTWEIFNFKVQESGRVPVASRLHPEPPPY